VNSVCLRCGGLSCASGHVDSGRILSQIQLGAGSQPGVSFAIPSLVQQNVIKILMYVETGQGQPEPHE